MLASRGMWFEISICLFLSTEVENEASELAHRIETTIDRHEANSKIWIDLTEGECGIIIDAMQAQRKDI